MMPPENESTDTQSIRRKLSRLRALWGQHAPSKPMYLGEELEPGVTVSDFCVNFLVSQRSRRVVRTERGREANEKAQVDREGFSE